MKVSRTFPLFFLLLFLSSQPSAGSKKLQCAEPKKAEVKSCGLKPESLGSALGDIAKQCEKTAGDDLDHQYELTAN